jgi:nicotinate-nucleotide adenylyltransferase
MSRIAIFGGSFDPIHFGHLIIAQDLISYKKADSIVFLPTSFPPHKRTKTDFGDRIAMVDLAISGNSTFTSRDIETTLPKPSYTINTLRALKSEFSGDRIAFIIGMDSAVEFDTWREPEKLLEEFEILVIPRPGYKKSLISQRFIKRMIFIETRMIEISSSEIRKRIKRGKTVKYLTPDVVIKYIERNGLYR